LTLLLRATVLFVEFLIPVYNSYSALRFKRENSILSLLQYWSVVFLVEALFHVISPVFDELFFNSLLIKLPFMIWLAHPSLQGYKLIYTELIAPSIPKCTDFFSKVSRDISSSHSHE
ncbi:hypothetical protein WA538_000300, partial [Blastocystis sp. DL]